MSNSARNVPVAQKDPAARLAKARGQAGFFQRPARGVVAVIDWSSSATLKENARFLRTAGAADKIRPREWRDGPVKYRSLTLWEDGSCELQRFSTATVARRLGWSIARKVRMDQRG